MWMCHPETNSWYLCIVYGHKQRSIRRKGVAVFAALNGTSDAGGDQLSDMMGMTFQESRVEVARLSVPVLLDHNPIQSFL